MVFRQNSGQQCVAKTLCALIYSNKQGINSANDIVSIMNIGNQTYSSLFQLTLRWNMTTIPQFSLLSYKRRRSNEETKSPPTWIFPLATTITYICQPLFYVSQILLKCHLKYYQELIIQETEERTLNLM